MCEKTKSKRFPLVNEPLGHNQATAFRFIVLELDYNQQSKLHYCIYVAHRRTILPYRLVLNPLAKYFGPEVPRPEGMKTLRATLRCNP